MRCRRVSLCLALLSLLLIGSNDSWGGDRSVLYAAKIYNNRNLTPEDASWIASHTDLLSIDGSGDHLVERMKAVNPDLKIFRYFVTCMVGDRKKSLSTVVGYRRLANEHPDWFLTDSEGQRIMRGDSRYLMDPGANGWAQYWLKQVLEVVVPLPYDGVHGDIAYIDIGGLVPEAKHRYPREEQFHRVQERFLGALHQGLNREGKLLILNNAIMRSRTDPDYLLNTRLRNSDGFEQQAVMMRWRNHPQDRFVERRRMEKSMEVFEQAARRGKIVMLGMQPSPDREEISYCVGCYLLVKSDPWVYLSVDWAGKYQHMRRLFEEYGDILSRDYGSPVGPRYREGKVWKREYTEGTVVVDPVKHTFDFVRSVKH